ncbi:MAG TPA: hypothetical protein VN289_04690 [Paraburkholderia sp.]|jgi:hypothetical protein|nr:hypothetical protein [Paraburkholderia sp.]
MTRAIPEHWLERLFARMESIYGSRFHDMWRDCEIAEVKATWREGLAGITDEGLKRGVAALFHEKSPPTLPRFLELCQPQPAMHTPNRLLTDEVGRTPSHEARAQLAEIAKRIGMREPGIAWARRVVDEAARGHVLPGNRLQVALDAIKSWDATHGAIHREREPGCDDEQGFVADATTSPEQE